MFQQLLLKSYNNIMEMKRRYEDKLVALEKFINKDNYIDLKNSRKDLRNLRTDLRKQASHDVENRESAILYIDGEFYEDLSNTDCLVQYNKAHNINKEKRINHRKNNFNEIAEEDHKIAFAHKIRLKPNIRERKKGALNEVAPFISHKKSKFNYFLFIEKCKDWRFFK